MARKRKNRTHLKGGSALPTTPTNPSPKSFIIKHGQVGFSITQLVRDIRKVMEPNTASRLKVPLRIHGLMLQCTLTYNQGTEQEQAQGLFDTGTCLTGYSFACIYHDAYRPFIANHTSIRRPHLKLQG